MTKRQEDKLNMYDAVLMHYQQHAQAADNRPALQNAYAALKTTITAIHHTVAQQIASTKGHAANKQQQKRNLCEFGNMVAGAVFAWAIDTTNPVIREQVNITAAKLYALRDEELGKVATLYYEIAIANAAALIPYSLTQDITTAFKQCIDNYQAAVPAPRNALAQRTMLTHKLVELFAKADALLYSKIDKLVLLLKMVNLDYFEAYKTNRRIVNSATSSTGIRFVAKDEATNETLNGTHIHIKALGLEAITNNEGQAMVKPISPGVYTVAVTNKQYQPQIIPHVKTTMGKTHTVGILLRKVESG